MRRMYNDKEVISKVKIDENNVLVVEDAAGNKQEFEIQGGGQPQFEQVIVKMNDCIDQERTTQDYICFSFDYEINTFFPIQIVRIIGAEHYLAGTFSVFGGSLLKFNNTTYNTGAAVEDISTLILGNLGYGTNEIAINRNELEDFSRYDEDNDYYFILYKTVGNTKAGGWEI